MYKETITYLIHSYSSTNTTLNKKGGTSLSLESKRRSIDIQVSGIPSFLLNMSSLVKFFKQPSSILSRENTISGLSLYDYMMSL